MFIDESDIYKSCSLCPRDCLVDRTKNSDGICGMDMNLRIASFGPHYGEEPELVGFTASGTIFLSGCSLLCEFCQNYDISHQKHGRQFNSEELTEMILNLQQIGCTNINLVTPTHFSPSLINAIIRAKDYGLKLPVVYNSSGYEKAETLKMWEGIVDIYMPDFKFVDSEKSKLYCDCPDYFDFASQAILEMQRQTGNLVIKNGIARRGLLIRHLVLPKNQSDTKEVIDFIAEKIGTDTYLNLMDQYRPAHEANKYNLLNTRTNKEEFYEFVNYAKSIGFTRPDWLYQ